jgi:hypothetical protein
MALYGVSYDTSDVKDACDIPTPAGHIIIDLGRTRQPGSVFRASEAAVVPGTNSYSMKYSLDDSGHPCWIFVIPDDFGHHRPSVTNSRFSRLPMARLIQTII